MRTHHSRTFPLISTAYLCPYHLSRCYHISYIVHFKDNVFCVCGHTESIYVLFVDSGVISSMLCHPHKTMGCWAATPSRSNDDDNTIILYDNHDDAQQKQKAIPRVTCGLGMDFVFCWLIALKICVLIQFVYTYASFSECQ